MECRGRPRSWVGRLCGVAALGWVIAVCGLGLSSARPASASFWLPPGVSSVVSGVSATASSLGQRLSTTTTTKVRRTTTTTKPRRTTTTVPATTTTRPSIPVTVTTVAPHPSTPATVPKAPTTVAGPPAGGARVRALVSGLGAGTNNGAGGPPAATGPPTSFGATTPSTNLMHEPLVLSAAPWRGISLSAATHLGVPIAFGLLVGGFALFQAFIDRRDPKLLDAPARIDDDSVPFE